MRPVAGPSPSSLARKLGIVDGAVVVLQGPPPDLQLDVPKGVTVRRQLRGNADVVLVFVTSSSQLHRRFERLAASVFPSGGLWIAWP